MRVNQVHNKLILCSGDSLPFREESEAVKFTQVGREKCLHSLQCSPLPPRHPVALTQPSALGQPGWPEDSRLMNLRAHSRAAAAVPGAGAFLSWFSPPRGFPQVARRHQQRYTDILSDSASL